MERSSPDLEVSTACTEDEQLPTQHIPEQDPASEDGSLLSNHLDSIIDEQSPSSACPDNNIEEEKKKKGNTTNDRSSWSLLWEFELWTWFGSVSCFIAIIVVLAILSNKESPNWYFEITPNAVIQLLATFSQALLMASVSAGMGQKKWLRMLSVRPMIDFHRLDQSSRGPWGSLVLLISRRGGPMAFEYGFDPELMPGPYIALFSPPHTEFIAKAHCGTGNCTWESYETLAVCNTCKDLSSSLNRTRHDEKYSYTLPNGFGTSPRIGLDTVLNMTTSENANTLTREFWKSVAFSNNGSQLLSVFAVGSSPGVPPARPDNHIPDNRVSALPVAHECLLQYCLREMRATWTNNTFNETIVYTWTNQSQGSSYLTWSSPYVFTSSKTGMTFYIHNDALKTTSNWLTQFLNGSVIVADSLPGPPFSSTEFSGAVWRAMNSSATGFPDLMDNLANRLSLSLREFPYQPIAVGQSSTASYIAFVRWWWLALPIFELVASLFFLVVIMVETKKAGMAPWRNDILASFFYGFDHRPVVRDKSHGLEEEARQLLAEFRRDESGGGRLVAAGMTDSK
ncbi:hypothetical protein PG985_007545 [Apiospora marii]|uniref:Uncharacterized protein n=1 Tax=Apiospora marii TaxID=335849 RepID=A0ABR1SNM2_9PEZI